MAVNIQPQMKCSFVKVSSLFGVGLEESGDK